MDTMDRLDAEIKRLHDRMTKLEPESKEYEDVENKYLKLMSQKLEYEKYKSSVEQNDKQMKADFNDRVARYIIDGGKVVLTVGSAVGMGLLAYTFEAKGVVPVGIGKKWVDKLTKY